MASEKKSSKQENDPGPGAAEGGQQGRAAVKSKPARRKSPKKIPPTHLPPWKVLLHNDDQNEVLFVVRTIVELTPLKEREAVDRTKEAHETGVSLILTTHKERAELYMEQFESKGLTVTIEPAEK